VLFYGTYFLGIGLRLAFEASEQNAAFFNNIFYLNINNTHQVLISFHWRFCHGINVNDPEDLRVLKESISSLNQSDKNFEDNLFSVELFVDK
jgi:hypothetical protein